jgi:flavin-dependent dehydrogenase
MTSAPLFDALVVGGGPAGLGFAIAAAQRGLSVVVLERRRYPVDKVCGEGLLPAGVSALEQLGLLPHLLGAESWPIQRVRYLDSDGGSAEVELPGRGGLGVRRTRLSAALVARARELGVLVVEGAQVVAHRITSEQVEVEARVASDGGDLRGSWRGRLLVAADGLNSKLRVSSGLDRPSSDGPQRFGVSTHFAVEPWSCAVEVYLAEGFEAYVTPLAPQQLGVAFLWRSPAPVAPLRIDTLLQRIPRLSERLVAGGVELSALGLGKVHGLGPMARAARRPTAHRLALLGDAAGYVDALTGEGVSLALQMAIVLASELAFAFARDRSSGALAGALHHYGWRWRLAFLRYAALARSVVFITSHRRVRRGVLTFIDKNPMISGLISSFVLA